MKFLFDSRGYLIANEVRGHLHSPSGQNIGHYRENERIFIDMSGRYLGEIVREDRQLYKTSSPYRSVSYGSYGNYGNPGNKGSIGSIGGYRDIEMIKW
ncbi:hypothetical protein D3P08_03840 [Paenibacillus nanensis]|uniref:Uncharacterized protein n=1 Tax=Paenibacillus nanensis TaxID=393251 RepID=A0A3A1VFF5_9BACL|nr:hypothetical protein [Paenibacillus nanensis]RIX59297.1 hypothetical protein D3P08_03840 [Paenibacillus nanensis]